MQWKKPDVGAEYPICSPLESDFFDGSSLGLQWQWNANVQKKWYEISGNRLRLFAQKKEAGQVLSDMPNLLLQKWPAPEFQITVCLYLKEMQEGDVCGLISFGGKYFALCVMRRNGKFVLQLREGDCEKREETGKDITIISEIGNKVYLRMLVEKEKQISFRVSTDDENYLSAGAGMEAVPGKWTGVKAGLFAVNESESCKSRTGSIEATYFIFERLGQ